MKQAIRKLFSPLLKRLESGEVGPNYKASHRTILIAVGTLFMILGTISLVAMVYTGQLGAFVPVVAFLGLGGVCLIVGSVGTDAAVSKLWGHR
ncbi:MULTISPECIES: hypothetical protein [Marinobacter]|uniref:Uncharacterized protein n=1 Tax=Marinobacter suaedae TaxID=3057675 RepID=A0ABT8VZ27_9GAMM|nr:MULTISPECIES: hypothetical protein [unclassified Marinobacter]MBZ2169378.1 hypothetical protein [Marinobacter sp. F4216]MDO3721243.1 hypothetical protein [Marinobacter sp. chi1]